MNTRKKITRSLIGTAVSAAVIASSVSVHAESIRYARAIGEPPEPETQPVPRTTPAPAPAPTTKPPQRAPAPAPTAPEPVAKADTAEEGGFKSSYIWIGLGVAAALAALGGGGGGGGGNGGGGPVTPPPSQ